MDELLEMKDYIDFAVSNPYYRKDRNYYFMEIELFFTDKEKQTLYRGGFTSKKEAVKERDKIIGQLYTKTFVVKENVKVSDFFILWLENVMRPKITYNSYLAYRNVVYNYLAIEFKNIELSSLQAGRISEFYRYLVDNHNGMFKLIHAVLKTGLEYALKKKIISSNPIERVKKPKKSKSIGYRTINIDSSSTLTIEQLKLLIESAKNTPIYLHVLFAGLMGLRLSEILGLKYSDIDFLHRTLKVQRQLGVDPKKSKDEVAKKQYTKQEIKVKSFSSNRELEIPDIVFEAIQQERREYEKNRHRRINDKSNPFRDWDYICCSTYGNPRGRGFHKDYFKRLLEINNLPQIRFHDLRKTYSTMLLKEGFSGKAVSKLMGHASEIITVDVYGDNKNIVCESLPLLDAYIDEVIPKEEVTNLEKIDVKIDQNTINELLPN